MAIRWDHLKEIRDFIAKLPNKACNMEAWQDIEINKKTDAYFTFGEMTQKRFSCGSAACIGGWTEMYANKQNREERWNEMLTEPRYVSARKHLGLNTRQVQLLFYDFPYHGLPRGYNWKKWMLERLDTILKEKKIRGYMEQMPIYKGED